MFDNKEAGLDAMSLMVLMRKQATNEVLVLTW